MRVYIGIDNGISGSVGILECTEDDVVAKYFLIPIVEEQDYTKKKQYISRVELDKFCRILSGYKAKDIILRIERPMVNPTRFKASVSALRAHEAMLIGLQMLNFPYEFIDSKQWQKDMLPNGVKGSAELKKLSLQAGRRLFPQLKDRFKGDADGILIAEWIRRNYK